jgi:hypothetical protein
MPRDRQAVGSCPRCNRGTVNCSHNKFMDGERRFHFGAPLLRLRS